MLDSLFENIGYKIKNLAKVSFVVESLCSIVVGLFNLIVKIMPEIARDDDAIIEVFICIFYMLCAVAGAYLLSMFLYGFGCLVESSEQNRNINSKIYDKLSKMNECSEKKEEKTKKEDKKEVKTEKTEHKISVKDTVPTNEAPTAHADTGKANICEVVNGFVEIKKAEPEVTEPKKEAAIETEIKETEKDENYLKKSLIKTLNYSTLQGMRSNLNYIKNSATTETEKHLIDSILEADDINLVEKIEEVINSL